MQSFLRFRPLPQERVWGGRALETRLGRALPPDRPFGESWEIVDRPEAQSVIAGGPLDGLTLRQAIERHSAEIMGPRWPKEKPFPILVKWLDCRERLSLQVHPPAAVAQELGGEPKTENWFVADAAPDAHLFVGLKPGVTREQFERALADGTLEECVNRVPVAAGDSVLVRSGQVHAIGGGNLILEIQQNSDTTYRAYDWGRAGLDGKPRQLHIAESLRSILWDAAPPEMIKDEHTQAVLADTAEFRIWRVRLVAHEMLRIAAGQQPRVFCVIRGRLSSHNGELSSGDSVVLPYGSEFVFNALEDALMLVTENFSEAEQGRATFAFNEPDKFDSEDLAIAWIEHSRQWGLRKDGSFRWAWERLFDFSNHNPELLWPIILRLVELSTDDRLLAAVASGPLENMIEKHGALFIERIEAQARRDKKFSRCLSGVWGVPKSIEARVKAAKGNDQL